MQLELFPIQGAKPATPEPVHPEPTRVTNLRDVARHVETSLEPKKRAEVGSALNTISRAVGRSLAELPVEPGSLRIILEGVDPIIARIGHGRWLKLRQHLGAALRAAGIEVFPSRDEAPSSPEWQRILSAAKLKREYGLQRLAKYMTRRGIEPWEVTAAHFEEFRVALLTKSLLPRPELTWRAAARTWNRAAMSSEAWPQLHLEVEPDKRLVSFPWTTFPASLREDMDEYLHAGGDLEAVAFEEAPRPLAAATIDMRLKLLRLIASTYHLATGRGAELVDLATLVEPDRVHAAMTKLKEIHGGVRPSTLNAAELLLKIARHYVRADSSAEKIAALAKNWRKALKLKSPTKGMRLKNRQRLAQFDDVAARQALLALPEKVRRQTAKIAEPSHGDVRRLMFAVALEILLVAPVRLKNLVSLEVGRHVTWHGKKQSTCRLWIPSDEIKCQGETIDAKLPEQTSDLLLEYIERYRQHLTSKPTTFLFPNNHGEQRNGDGFSDALKDFLRRELGVLFNTHLFRGLAANLHLERHPEAMDNARRLLGHQSAATTEKYYIHLKNERAVVEHGKVIQELRGCGPKRNGPK